MNGANGNQRDDAVLWVVIGFCLVTPVVLTTLWSFNDRFYPPMLLAILLGIAIAALIYRYLGGTEGSSFSVGALKIVGSAALLLGTAYMANLGLSEQMDAGNAPKKLLVARAALAKAIEQRDSALRENEILKGKLETAEGARTQVLVSELAKLSPTSLLGSQLVELARKRQGPFSAVEKVLNVKVTVIGGDAIKSKDSLFACADLALDGEVLKISRVIDNETRAVSAKQTGIIESVVCDKSPRNFDVQLSCAAGEILFAEDISGCTEKGDVKWRVPKQPRFFPVSMEVLAQ